MAQEREVVSPSGSLPSNDINELVAIHLGAKTPEEKQVAFDKLTARLRVQILDRGVTNDRLFVPLPDDVHGEWVPNDKEEIYRKINLGFKIDDEYAIARALHSQGDGKSIVGDVVFMTCPKVVKEVFDRIRLEEYIKMNSKKKINREERLYVENNEKAGLGEGTSLIGSSQDSVSGTEIENALRDGKSQMVPSL